MTFDIFNPQISVVAKGLEGKVLLVYGSNNLGKTKQATRMKKPFHLGFEQGLNAIAGVPFLPINSWADFKKINKQLTNPKTLDKVKELYNTIIFDEVYASSLYCQYYICTKYDAETMGDRVEGKNLYQEYEREYLREIDKLIKAGFTVVFIGHAEFDKDMKQIRPKGDKRSMGVIIDNSDIVVYLKSNGVDDKGNVIKSSAYLAETPEYFARSRFDYIDTYIEEYTAENLENVIIKAIEKQEKKDGIKAVSFVQQRETKISEELDFETVYNETIATCKELASKDSLETVTEIIEEHLGKGKKVSDCTKSQVGILSLILDDLRDKLKEIEDKEIED
ncbi:ATP-binding protein [Paenibacillus naphthalenovorans]|uniref:AAA domain-containing protein n=1 Tax=Paenibacillus naphthalenovorans TaxID=162209 RepID=A0A0U2MWE0_9BACL|nr:ATP-binding protein [Paenibacillus naphthalenovorans]ALS22191.1 AAA domain-containing protein [Paenibacillus naphthalenovorans]